VNTSELRNPADERLDHQFHRARRMDTLVILGHGVTGNKDRPLMVALAEGLSAKGWPCLRLSFSGNGQSEGRFEDCTITKEIDDLAAVLDGVPDFVRVIYMGHSMGAAVGVLAAATDVRIRALVSLAGMTHTADFLEREFGSLTPGSACMWDEPGCPLSQTFVNDMKSIGNTLSAAARILQPWLLIHGLDDDVVPVQDSRDAFAAAICVKKLLEIPGAGHSFDESSYPLLIQAIDRWLLGLFEKS
jgi:pimeloyl-ACP methyl ester carboxylesterase